MKMKSFDLIFLSLFFLGLIYCQKEINSCKSLQEIEMDNTTSSYFLSQDIDCSDIKFNTLGGLSDSFMVKKKKKSFLKTN